METTAEVKNPFQSAPNSKKMLVVVALFCGVIGSILNSATLSTLLPVAAQEIGGVEYYSLASTLTGVISVAAMPLWGYLCARNASLKRPLYVFSLIISAVVVLARAFAPNMMMIAIPATLYGFASAGIFVIGYGLVRDMFDPAKAGTYLGLNATVQGIAMLVGPVAAGFLMDAASWRIVCHIIWPFLLLSGILMMIAVPKLTKEESAALSRQGGKFDFSGTIALCIFLAALMLGLSLGSSFLPFGSMPSNGVFALAVISLIWLIAVMIKKKGEAVIPTPAFSDRNTVSLAVSNFCSMFANMSVFFFIPTYLLYVLGASATEAGLATSLLSIAPLFMGPIFGRMVGKAQNARFVISIGLVIRIAVCVGCLVCAMIGAPIIAFYALMVIGGFYGASQSVGFSVGPQVQIPENLRMQGNSVVQVGQNFGGSVGTAIYTVLIGVFGIGTGLFYAFGLAAVVSIVGLLFSLRLKKLSDY